MKKRTPIDFWKENEVWFQKHVPDGVPWGDETLLTPVPEDASGSFGIELNSTAQIDSEIYREGQVAIVDSKEDWMKLLSSTSKVRSLLVPWFDRLIPVSLAVPHTKTIELSQYRKKLEPLILKSLAISVGLGVVAYLYPQFLMLALIGAMFYGLFPLVSSCMAWSKRVDRLSVSDLNDEMARDVFFRLWVASKKARGLIFGVVVLVLLFVGQLLVGPGESLQAAALIRSKVEPGGEWWRIVTAGLMHGGILHIFFNGSALFSLGRIMNALVRGGMLPTVFLVSVVTGSLASITLRDSEIPSVGASGGILGCVGFLLVYAWRFRGKLPEFLANSLIQCLIVLSIFGFLGSRFIDNAAHAGGFLGGVVVALLTCRTLKLGEEAPSVLFRLIGWTSCLILGAGAIKVAYELWLLKFPG